MKFHKLINEKNSIVLFFHFVFTLKLMRFYDFFYYNNALWINRNETLVRICCIWHYIILYYRSRDVSNDISCRIADIGR